MSPVFPSRRRADEFQGALEGSSAPSSRHAEALALVSALRESSPVEPSPEFVAGLRGRLMAEADTALVGGRVPDSPARDLTPRLPRRERRLAAAVGSFALVGATASMAVAAQGALPGETLYPLKRALENAQAGVQGGVDEKGITILASASGRLDEVDELSRDTSSQDPAVISSTLDEFSEQASEASELLLEAYDETGRPELIDDVRVFASQSMTSLRDLEPLVPRESRAALISASQVLRAIDQTAMEACPTCSAAFLDQAPLLAASTYEDLITDLVATVPEPETVFTKQTGKAKGQKKPSGSADSSTDAEPQVSVTTDAPETVPAPSGGDQTNPKPPRNPVKDLADSLLSGGKGNTNGPRLDDVVEGVEDTVNGVTDPLLP